MARILGIDTGMRGTGLVVLEAQFGKRPQILSRNVVHTEPSAKKRRTHKADDDRRRLLEIRQAVRVEAERADAAVVEDFTFGMRKNVSAAARQFGAWAAVICTLDEIHIPVVQLTPQEIRKRLTGGAQGTKGTIWEAVPTSMPDIRLERTVKDEVQLADGRGVLSEHEADALCAALAALSPPDDVLLAILRMAQERGP